MNCFAAAASILALSGCLFHRHRSEDLATPVNPGDQPDKILFDKAINEIEHNRFDVGRLTLQTLLNTYPDSEYLAKAKLAIADSYYEEGGTSGLTQAEVEYKDFITFFPTAPEAPEAQFRAGMAHFRLMGKADRDRTEAKLAEAELKEFLLKYPDSDMMPRVKARLREVQEVLAQGEFKIAKFYYQKQANRAAKSRFEEIADRYSNFSQGDEALWYLGQTLERLRKPNDAVPYYGRILSEYPLSPLVGQAKDRLTAMHQPLPRPTKAILARAQADASHHTHKDIFEKMTGMMSSGPDLTATRRGPVHLGPPSPSATEASRAPAAATPGSTIVASPVGEEALKAGQPVETKPSQNDSPQADAAGSSQTSGAEAKPEGAKASDPAVQPKKKHKKSLFKKLNPF